MGDGKASLLLLTDSLEIYCRRALLRTPLLYTSNQTPRDPTSLHIARRCLLEIAAWRRGISKLIRRKRNSINVHHARRDLIEHLKMHIRTHTNEKPYQCTYCQKRFAQSGDLKSAYPNSHQGETLSVYVLSEEIRSKWLPKDAYPNTHQGETFSMWILSEEVCRKKKTKTKRKQKPESTYQNSH